MQDAENHGIFKELQWSDFADFRMKKNYESRTFDFYEKKSDNLYAIPFM